LADPQWVDSWAQKNYMRLIKQSPDRKGGISASDKPKNAEKKSWGKWENLKKTGKFLKKYLQKSGQRL
jgi:hypothetical protein